MIYTASWCSQCYKLDPPIEEARHRGVTVEVRDIDHIQPGDKPRVRVVPTLYTFRNGAVVDKVEGVAACIATLEKLP